MKVKTGNLKELGKNLMTVVKLLAANEKLTKLLYYTNDDPYSEDTPDFADIYRKRIIVIPLIDLEETGQSTVSLRVTRGIEGPNTQFENFQLDVEVFVPNNHWEIVDTNLRPFAIMGEIRETLKGQKIDGLGTISGGDFALNYITEEMTVYEMFFRFTSYA